MTLTQDVIEDAFAYARERREDFVKIMASEGIKPGPDKPMPTGHDFRRWTLEEWAGFFHKHVTPRKRSI